MEEENNVMKTPFFLIVGSKQFDKHQNKDIYDF